MKKAANIFRIFLSAKRIYGLDVLRALAIIFVLIQHGKSLVPLHLQGYYELFIFDGVSIFFVLSGFLIGGILIKLVENNTASGSLLLDFWLRRWFRTIPNYLFILTVLVIINYFFTPLFSVFGTKWYYLFSQNIFWEHPPFFPEAWSLSVEEWFYLLIPSSIFLFISMMRFSPRKAVIYSALLILIVITIFRFYRHLSLPIGSFEEWDLVFRKQVFTRLDSLMYGIIGAYFNYYLPSIWKKYKKEALVLGMILFIFLKVLFLYELIAPGSVFNCVFSFSFTSIATLLLLPFLSGFRRNSGVIYKTISHISLISYSMYLINLSLVQGWIINKIPWYSFVENPYVVVSFRYGFYWLLTILLSTLIYKYFELPMMNFRDKIKAPK